VSSRFETMVLKLVIKAQQSEIDTLTDSVRELQAQVARLVAAVPSAGRRATLPACSSFYDLTDEEKITATTPTHDVDCVIKAIKMVRARTGCSPVQAKEAVDAYRFGRATK